MTTEEQRISRSKTKNVVLHVGVHKTGTTSIQLALRDYDDGETTYAALGDPNHSILFQTLFEEDNLFSHWQRLGLSRGAHQRLVSEWFEKLETQLAREKARLIFVGENISLMSGDALSRVRDYFVSRNCSIKVVAYVRNPLAWTASLIQEMTKHGYFPNDFIRREVPIEESLRQRLDRLIGVFGRENVEVIRYEDAKCSGDSTDVVEHFCQLLKIRRDSVYPTERQNETVNEAVFKVLLNFYHSGVTHNVGSMLERVRWKFNACLERALSVLGAKKPDIERFRPFVNWDDYRKLNELLESPYELEGNVLDASLPQEFRTYWQQIDEKVTSAALHSALSEFDVGQPSNATTHELTVLLFYGVMREDAKEPLKRRLEEVQQQLTSAQQQLQQQLESTQQQLESTQQQLESTQQQLESTQQQLESTQQQLQKIKSSKVWRSQQKMVNMKNASKRAARKLFGRELT